MLLQQGAAGGVDDLAGHADFWRYGPGHSLLQCMPWIGHVVPAIPADAPDLLAACGVVDVDHGGLYAALRDRRPTDDDRPYLHLLLAGRRDGFLAGEGQGPGGAMGVDRRAGGYGHAGQVHDCGVVAVVRAVPGVDEAVSRALAAADLLADVSDGAIVFDTGGVVERAARLDHAGPFAGARRAGPGVALFGIRIPGLPGRTTGRLHALLFRRHPVQSDPRGGAPPCAGGLPFPGQPGAASAGALHGSGPE